MVASELKAASAPAGSAKRCDQIEFCGRGSDADRGRGRCGDADSSHRCTSRWTATTIPLLSGVGVWLATGHTDMRKSFPSSVKGGVGRRDALLGPTAAKDIALTSSSTAHFSPVDSQEKAKWVFLQPTFKPCTA
jgi:hypothetical protein